MKKIFKIFAVLLVLLGVTSVAACNNKNNNVKGRLETTQTYSTIKMTCTVEDPDNAVNTKSVYVVVRNDKDEKVSTHNFTTLPLKDSSNNYLSETLTATGLTADTTYFLTFYCTIGTEEHVFERKEVKTTNEGLSDEDPILINTVDDLYAMTNNLKAHYKLNADLDLGSTTDRTAVFNSSNPFNGTLDGANHTISNFYTATSNQEISLFGYIGESGVIKNVNLKAPSIGSESTALKRSSDTRIGTFASTNYGTLTNNKVVEAYVNCESSTTSSTYTFYAGGFVGLNKGLIENCSIQGTVKASAAAVIRVGGFVGLDDVTDKRYSIVNSTANTVLDVTLNSKSSQGSEDSKYTVVEHVGGFAGEVSGHIKDCVALGSITASYEYYYSTAIINPLGSSIGGFAGTTSDSAWIVGCVASNDINYKSESCLLMNIGLMVGTVGLHAIDANYSNNVYVAKDKELTLTLTKEGVYKRTKTIIAGDETTTVDIDRNINLDFYGSALASFKEAIKEKYAIVDTITFTCDEGSITFDVLPGVSYESLTLADSVKTVITSLLSAE